MIAQIVPGTPLIDLTHGIARQDVRQGAIALANALPSCPRVSISRWSTRAWARPAAQSRWRPPRAGCWSARTTGCSPGRWIALGGALDAVEISRSPFRLEPVSATFHGRDLFAPVAAHLALGARLEEAGEPIDPASLTALDLPTPAIGPATRS